MNLSYLRVLKLHMALQKVEICLIFDNRYM
jgi:hypothetical protein